MSEFTGFSDREIKSVQRDRVERGGGEGGPIAPRKSADFSRPRKNTSHRGRGGYFNHRTLPPPDATGLPQTAYIVQQSQQAPTTIKTDQTKPHETKNEQIIHEKDVSLERRESENDMSVLSDCNAATETSTEGDTNRVPDLCLDTQATAASHLESLQKQQRQLEDENKKKKALVEQTLQERYAKSQMEAKTLHSVKEELARLDSLLTRDVTILRRRIEEADRQYTAARKRYDLAEAEFVAAKLELHRSSESKELLSEHLCTIIQQNEIRKAEKLANLLKTLKLENMAEDSSHSHSVSIFQKTPTPGTDIWPRERLGSDERAPSQKETGLTGSKTTVANDTSHDITTLTNIELLSVQEQRNGTSPTNTAAVPESITTGLDIQDSRGKDNSSSPLIEL